MKAYLEEDERGRMERRGEDDGCQKPRRKLERSREIGEGKEEEGRLEEGKEKSENGKELSS